MENLTAEENKNNESLQTNSEKKEINISEDDFKLILNILIVLSKRGAFNIDEYNLVGDLFNRLKIAGNL